MKTTKEPITVSIRAAWDSNGKDRTRIVIEGPVDLDLLSEVEYHRFARPDQTEYLDPANERDAKRIKELMRRVDPDTWNESNWSIDIPGEGRAILYPIVNAGYQRMDLRLDVEGWNMSTDVMTTKTAWSMRDGKLWLKLVAHKQ